MIRQTILAGVSRLRRQHLHRRAADAIERSAGEGAPELAAQIAEHLRRAGAGVDPARLWAHLVAAGHHAMATAGFEEALRHFERAQERGSTAGPEQRAGLWGDLAMARRSVGRLPEAHEAWVAAIDGYEALGDAHAMARACAEGANDLAWDNRDREGFEVAQRGLAALGPSAPVLRARLLAISAGVGAWSVAPWEVVDPMISEAIALASSLAEDQVLGEALFHDASLSVAFSQHARAADSGLRGGGLLRAAGDIGTMTQSYVFALIALIELGRFDTMASLADEVGELGRRWGIFPALWAANWAQAVTSIAIDGDLDRWEATAQEARELGVGLNAPSMVLPRLGLARFLRGDWDGALELVAEGAGHPLTNRVHGMEVGPLLQLRAYLGDRDGALEILDRERLHLPRGGGPSPFGSWQLLGYAVEGLAMLGARKECAALYPLAAEFAASGVVLTVYQGRLTQRVAGMAAATAGRWDEAEAHFTAALRQADELPHRTEVAETSRFLAMTLLDRNHPGDRERAAQALARADARYREIGAPRHVDLVGRLLAQCRAHTPPPPA